MKGFFLIKAKEKKIIQDKGIRAFVLEKILESSLEKGSAINLPDGKTVEVRLQGKKKSIENFIENLKKELIQKLGNPTVLFSEFHENELEIPSLVRSSQALVVGQLSKGIQVNLQILNSFDKFNKKLNKLDELDKLKGLNKLNKLNKLDKLDELSKLSKLDKLDDLGFKVDALPKKIAEELKKVLSSSN